LRVGDFALSFDAEMQVLNFARSGWVVPVMSVIDDPMPDLLRGMRSPMTDIRNRAARALGRLGLLARDAIPNLVNALNDPEAAVRESAAHSIGLMGAEAIPHLIVMLHHQDKYVRRNAVWALGKLGSAASSAVPNLCHALRDADPRVASGAAQALGSLGVEANEAIPALTEAMRGTNIVLCRLASKALSMIGPAALPSLMAHLRHRDPFVRGEAALAIGWMGTSGLPAVAGLVECLRMGQPDNLDTAMLIAHNGAAPIAPPTPEDNSRMFAAQALGRIGPFAAHSVPALKLATKDTHEQVRQAAEVALRLIQNG
jgi:HEAT repeat protein